MLEPYVSMSWHPGGPVGNPHSGRGYSGRNRGTSKGGSSGVQRSSAAQLRENEPLFTTYEHLQGLQRGDAALTLLRKIAVMVKPIMRKRGWRVQVLAEFLPPEQNLLGLNINKGYKICIRLRYHHSPDLFLPLEELVDTMLHELSHNVWGEHDSNFHRLWDELRDEHETLLRKGYTGEGFLSQGQRLGGSGGHRPPPPHEMRRLARASAEKRKTQGTLGQGSGQRLGGTPLHAQGRDIRQVIVEQATRRNTIDRGCASGRKDAGKLSQQASHNTFRTKAEEDDANNRAIAQALYELMEEEERQKLNGTFKGSPSPSDGGLAWSPEAGLYNAGMDASVTHVDTSFPTEEEQMKWALQEGAQQTSTDSDEYDTTKSRLPIPKPTGGTQSARPVPLECKSGLSSRPPQAEGHAAIRREQTESSPGSSLASASTIKQGRTDFGNAAEAMDASQVFPEEHWTCGICTLVNPLQYLACDACGVERPQSVVATKASKLEAGAHKQKPATMANARREPGTSGKGRWELPPPKQDASLGWKCGNCGAFMEHKWWTCSACGLLKASS